MICNETDSWFQSKESILKKEDTEEYSLSRYPEANKSIPFLKASLLLQGAVSQII